MERFLRLITAAVLSLGFVQAKPALAEESETAGVAATIARSKLTRETYAVYFWTRIQQPGQRVVEEWSAEFNSGALHRVETPRDRLIADCDAQTGTFLSLVTREIIAGPKVARLACGIDTNLPFLSAEALGRVKTRFGDADQVRVTDAQNIRTYAVSDKGIILRSLFKTNDRRRLTVLQVEAVDVTDHLPGIAMFDAASLQATFVPDRFRAVAKPAE